jgi:hypothetical protein
MFISHIWPSTRFPRVPMLLLDKALSKCPDGGPLHSDYKRRPTEVRRRCLFYYVHVHRDFKNASRQFTIEMHFRRLIPSPMKIPVYLPSKLNNYIRPPCSLIQSHMPPIKT